MLDSFKIGHFTDEQNGTGATVIICEKGAVGGACVRGAAPATRETDLLKSGKLVQKINAVVLSGGSAFGLESACGVMDYLHEKGLGYNAGKYKVPIVAGASIYDLEYKNFAYPQKQDGYTAAQNAEIGNFALGNIGAGTGAMVSKVMGAASACKGGLGIATYNLNNIEIAIIVAVNALGDIIKDGKIILGAQGEDGSYLDCLRVFSAGSLDLKDQNTTIGCIITNANITKEQANTLCSLAHDGLALSLSPAHTMFDGDAIFCMASGEQNIEFNILTAIIPNLCAKAVQSVAEQASASISHKVNRLAFKIFEKVFKR